MNERDEQWYRRELDRVTKERDRARHEHKEMRAIVRQQTAAYECLEAEREQIANMALEAVLQAPHHKIWYLERIMEACGAPVDKWREQHEWEEGVAP